VAVTGFELEEFTGAISSVCVMIILAEVSALLPDNKF